MKRIRGIIFLLTIIGTLLVATGTFSYFVLNVDGSINGTTNNFVFNVSGFNNENNREIILSNPRGGIMPGDSGSFDITLNMSGTETDIIYSVDIRKTNMPAALNFYYDENHKTRFINCSEFVAQNSTMTQVITVYWYWNIDVDDADDSLYINTTLSASIDINIEQQVYGEMRNGGRYAAESRTDFWSTIYAPYIRTVNFIDNTYSVPDTCNLDNLCFDITATDSKYPVYGYLIDSGYKNTDVNYTVGNSLYNLYIACDRQIYAPSSATGLFTGFVNLISINFNGNFNTSKTLSVYCMFLDCSSLEELDLSDFNTSKVTNFYGIFWNCENLKKINLTSFNTNRAINMEGMFYNCASLPSVNIDNFNMASVGNMRVMFSHCESLESLDMSNMNAHSVTNMNSMFSWCSNLTDLNMTGFTTGSVTDMGHMFDTCSLLTAVDLNGIYTTNLINMERMFSGCRAINSIDAINFDTSNVTNMLGIFDDCVELSKMNFGNFNVGNVTDMNYAFNDCLKLNVTITVSGNVGTYTNAFLNAATDASALITVNYTNDTSTLVDNMILTKSASSHVVKGSLVS